MGTTMNKLIPGSGDPPQGEPPHRSARRMETTHAHHTHHNPASLCASQPPKGTTSNDLYRAQLVQLRAPITPIRETKKDGVNNRDGNSATLGLELPRLIVNRFCCLSALDRALLTIRPHLRVGCDLQRLRERGCLTFSATHLPHDGVLV